MEDKPKLIMVFDSNLNYKGELKLPAGISVWTHFVSREGLHLLDYRKPDENHVKFAVYAF
jgi:hypothetical protein